MTEAWTFRRAWRAMARAIMPEPTITSSRIRTGGRTPAGVFVTPDTALKNAVVWACVQYLTKTVAHLPWNVLTDTAQGAVRAKTNPVDWLLGSRPCPDMGSFNWRQTMLGNALLWGNAYAEIERDNRGAAYALWPIHPQRVVVRRGEDGLLEYEVWNSGGNATLPASDVFHLRGFGDGPVGFNVIEYAAGSIGWAQATEIFGATYFGQGANPSAVVETGGKSLSPEGMELLRSAFNKLYSGPKGDKTVFLDNGYTYKQVSTNPNDAQFIETRQHQVDEICRWFGVPPHKVMHLLRATFSNIEHQSIEVVVDSITPWVKAFEEEANYKLFGANRQNYYTKIDLRGLLRGDNISRAQFYKSMFELGLPLNRILALEDENGIGPQGDVSFVSNNVQTLDRAIAATDPVPGIDLTDPAAIAASFRIN
jgi:HK97 family phage portal protein